jgi:CBS domain-containing protein
MLLGAAGERENLLARRVQAEVDEWSLGHGSRDRKREIPMTESSPRLNTIKTALDDIGTAGDTARLQLHLLTMRAKERTGELAANIEALEHKLDRNIEQAVSLATSKTRQLSGVVRDFLGQAAPPASPGVKAIMAETVSSCAPDDSLNAAAQRMWEDDCGAVPVIASDGTLAGIITDRDICMAAYTKGLALTAIRVKDVMARHVHTCKPEDTLERVANLMADAQIRRLPVVDAEGRLIGIVSLADIARGASVLGQREAAELVFQLLRSISQRPHAMPSERKAAE